MKEIVTLGLTGCSGCHVAIVSLNQKLLELLGSINIKHSYILMDEKKIPENVDLAIIEGGVRTAHDEEKVKEVRNKSKTIIALGSCSCFGGINALCNPMNLKELLNYIYIEGPSTIEGFIPKKDLPKVFSKVRPIGDFVKVDYLVPGCPPQAHDIENALVDLVSDKIPQSFRKNVCDECERERKGVPPKQFKRLHESVPNKKDCLLEQGFLCMGPATRGGCKAPCPAANVPCDGCRGPCDNTWDQGLAMIDALSGMSKNLINEYKILTDSGIFHRYTFASSLISKLMKKGEKNE